MGLCFYLLTLDHAALQVAVSQSWALLTRLHIVQPSNRSRIYSEPNNTGPREQNARGEFNEYYFESVTASQFVDLRNPSENLSRFDTDFRYMYDSVEDFGGDEYNNNKSNHDENIYATEYRNTSKSNIPTDTLIDQNSTENMSQVNSTEFNETKDVLTAFLNPHYEIVTKPQEENNVSNFETFSPISVDNNSSDLHDSYDNNSTNSSDALRIMDDR